MGEATGIGWTDHTFNPWMGCSRVSPGCDNCYAEALGKRTGLVKWGDDAERVMTSDAYWRNPLKWNRAAEAAGQSARVFCASLADVFEDRPELIEPRRRLFKLIEQTPWLTWQLLTKRPENVMKMTSFWWWYTWSHNVWIGTTVEDQERAEERIPHLLGIPASVRFLSLEPLLGPLDLSSWLGLEWMDALGSADQPPSFRGEGGWGLEMFGALAGRRPGIKWIIVGGESGPKHRQLDLTFARDVIDQALSADVPVFFKQVGGRTPKAGGDLLDGHQWKEFPLEVLR